MDKGSAHSSCAAAFASSIRSTSVSGPFLRRIIVRVDGPHLHTKKRVEAVSYLSSFLPESSVIRSDSDTVDGHYMTYKIAAISNTLGRAEIM
jgi:hypothetical protein